MVDTERQVDALVEQLGVDRGRRLIDVLGVVQHPEHLLALGLADSARGCGDGTRSGLGGGGLWRCRR